ncbi:MAG: ABC transporter permease [Porphyromonas sp.]|nr:ABC transporter permease [Porphyromonas sp.]
MAIFNKELWTELLYTLKRNKKRTIVTSLGVFAGMFFFTVLIGLSEGLGHSAFSMLEGITNNVIYFIPGRTTKPYQGYKANRELTTTYRDYQNVVRQNKLLKEVAASTLYGVDGIWGTTSVQANNKSRQVSVWGVTPNYFDVAERMIPLYGRSMTRKEIAQGEMLCMVGLEMAKRFYDRPEEMLGTYITVNGVAFRTIGIVKPFSDNFSVGNMGNEGIMIPISVAVGNNYDKSVTIMGVPKTGVTETEAKNDFFQIIAKRQHVDPTDTGAVITMSMSLFTNIFSMIGRGITVLVWIVGMGTLITGVISVSNILLVTVRERQREIGVRRAIGAKPSDIRKQFMAESIFIIMVAGVLGTLLGLLGSLVIGVIAENTDLGSYIDRPYPSVGLLLLSVVIMVVSGVLAGLLPVYKALQVKAIDAIRDE